MAGVVVVVVVVAVVVVRGLGWDPGQELSYRSLPPQAVGTSTAAEQRRRCSRQKAPFAGRSENRSPSSPGRSPTLFTLKNLKNLCGCHGPPSPRASVAYCTRPR